jgi:hypothetical protein
MQIQCCHHHGRRADNEISENSLDSWVGRDNQRVFQRCCVSTYVQHRSEIIRYRLSRTVQVLTVCAANRTHELTAMLVECTGWRKISTGTLYTKCYYRNTTTVNPPHTSLNCVDGCHIIPLQRATVNFYRGGTVK